MKGPTGMAGPRPAGRRLWTLTDDDMLRKLLVSGMKPRLIAQKMKRSTGQSSRASTFFESPASDKRAGTEGEEMSETMVAEIKVPMIAGAARLSIGRWFKRVGDPVSIDEPLVEIDTYNLTHEIRAPATGVLSKVLVRDGGSVEPGTVVGTIDQI